MPDLDPEIQRRYDALDDYGKRLVHEVGDLVLLAIRKRDERAMQIVEEVRKKMWCSECASARDACDEIKRRLEEQP